MLKENAEDEERNGTVKLVIPDKVVRRLSVEQQSEYDHSLLMEARLSPKGGGGKWGDEEDA
jgi:hypothetical protein